MDKRRWWMLTEEEADLLNPPLLRLVEDDDGVLYQEYLLGDYWLPLGHIPKPQNRLAWVIYHLWHGWAMGYPWWKVIGFALANNQPGPDIFIDVEELE